MLAVLIFSMMGGAAVAQVSKPPEELRVAIIDDYLPIAGKNIAGEFSGIIVDIWNLWSRKTGVPIRFISGNFAESVDAVRNGEADVHAALFRNPERQAWLSFSRSIYEAETSIFYWRNNENAPTLASFSGRAVGVIKGSHQESYLRESALRFRPRTFSRLEMMLKALARGEIAAIMHENLSMQASLLKNGITGDVGVISTGLLRNTIHAAVPRQNRDIRALVDYGFSQISHGEYAEIEQRWISDPNSRFFRSIGAKFPLSEAEENWLETQKKENRTFKIGVQVDWPPVAYKKPDGQIDGMTPELFKIVNNKLGGILELAPGRWSEMLKDLREGRLDGILDITALQHRMPEINFTSPYLVIPHIVAAKDGGIAPKSLNELNTKTIALERGYATIGYMRDHFPNVKIREYEDTFAALKAVANGEADAWAGNQAVYKHMVETHTEELKQTTIVATLPDRQSLLSFGTREEYDILRDILEKAIIGIDPQLTQKITEPWLKGTVNGNIAVNSAERRWLADHAGSTIRVAVDPAPPLVYMRDGQPRGIAIKYVQHALNALNLKAEYVPMAWADVLRSIGNFDQIDIIPSLAKSKEREQIVSISQTILALPRVIFTQFDAPLISSVTDLHGMTVAVEKGYYMETLLKADHPEIKLKTYETTHHALEAVSLGRADAYVGNLAAGSFHIEKHALTNLKVAAPSGYPDDEQSIGVRRDWPELTSLINKIIGQMTDQEHARIRSEALAVRFDHGINIREIMKVALPIGGVVLIIIGVIVYSNRKLSGEIVERKKAEEQLAESENWFKSLLESSPDATIIVDSHGKIIMVNRQAELVFGADRKKLLDQPIEILVPDHIRSEHVNLRESFITSTAPRSMGANTKLLARKFDGETFPVEISLSPIKTNKGTLIAASVRDVSERRLAEAKLEEQEIQLTAALENMSGGMFMVDDEMRMRVFNKKFTEMFRLPNIQEGTPLRDILTIRAIRGDYGTGDALDYVNERMDGYLGREAMRTEDIVPEGRVIEGYRQPTNDGGMVCIFNDITDRKEAEQALAEQTEKLQDLSSKLSRYLSPQIYQAIFSGASDANITTERKKLTVFFSDIKNFTATTEEMEPEDMTFLLNDYLTKMSEIALEYGGTIDKYIGDAIMVFFGDPETKGVKQDAQAAVKMAIAMQRRMVDLRAKWSDMGFSYPFHIRCGVNTGYCNVGNFGSEQRIDYTIIGGQVNLAARLESICEPDGVTISYETYIHVRDDIDAEAMEPIQVKGIRDPVQPYALKDIFNEWDDHERYIRRDDVRGLRLWVDLMRMNEEQRLASIKELEEAVNILKNRKTDAQDEPPD